MSNQPEFTYIKTTDNTVHVYQWRDGHYHLIGTVRRC